MHQQGTDLVPQHLGVERFEDEVHGTAGIALEHGILGLRDGRDKDDRGETRARRATHQARHFKAIHLRHLHVQQHQLDFVLQQTTQSGLAGSGATHLPGAVLQQGLHGHQVFLTIVHHQQGGRLIRSFSLHRHGHYLPDCSANDEADPAAPGVPPAWPGSHPHQRPGISPGRPSSHGPLWR